MSKSPLPPSRHRPKDPLRERRPDRAPDSQADRPDAVSDDAVSDGTMSDDLRRRDQRRTPPDSSLRSGEEEAPVTGHSLAPDGGVAQHPIHDEPEEDFTPRDYERQIDKVADELRAKARRAGEADTDKVSEER